MRLIIRQGLRSNPSAVLKEGDTMTLRCPETGNVEDFLEASRCSERWPSIVQDIVVFCKEGVRDHAVATFLALRNQHRQFGHVLHLWREALLSVSGGERHFAGIW